MRVFAEMTCCKPGRQQLGLACDAGFLACCLARQCAQLPELSERRAFAARVMQVEQIQRAGLVEWFREEVARQYAARRSAG